MAYTQDLAPIEFSFAIGSMKHQIVQCLSDYEGEIQKAVKQRAAEFLDKIDFNTIVIQECRTILEPRIREKVRDAIWSELNSKINKHTQKAVQDFMKDVKGAK